MKIITSLNNAPQINENASLTIGMFDGLHIGHQKIIQETQDLAKFKGKTVVLTYSNHPSNILFTDDPTQLICTTDHKIKLLEKMGIDLLILLEFTKPLSEKNAEDFLIDIRNKIIFSHLVLGEGATIGRNRKGGEELLKLLGKKHEFKTHYIPKIKIQSEIVSSTLIRKEIQSGDLTNIETYLGRPLSYILPMIEGSGRGRELGFPTLNFSTEGLCLPPLGVYIVAIRMNYSFCYAIANLGTAPTFDERTTPVFEVHIFDSNNPSLSKTAEIFPVKFIRSEKNFPSKEKLIEQMKLDVQKARDYIKKNFSLKSKP